MGHGQRRLLSKSLKSRTLELAWLACLGEQTHCRSFESLSQKVGIQQVLTKTEAAFIISLGQKDWVRVIVNHNYIVSMGNTLKP